MTEHPPAEPTPGPWEVATHSGGDGHEVDIQKPHGGGWFLRLSPGYPFAEFPDPEDIRAEFEANVRLIAAAPETAAERDRLVKVNKGLVEALEDCAELVNLWASKAGCQTEDAALKSDAEDFGSLSALRRARAALAEAQKS